MIIAIAIVTVTSMWGTLPGMITSQASGPAISDTAGEDSIPLPAEPVASSAGSDGEPYVEITAPDDGSTVNGTTLIEGVAGHTNDTKTTAGHQPATGDPVSPAPASASPRVLGGEPGGEIKLWFRGEQIAAGVGEPRAADAGQLRPTPPDGDVPVTHTGFWTLPSVRLQSPPLTGEVRLGAGDTEIPNQANTTFHLSTWTLNDFVGGEDWTIDLTATHPTQPDLPLARTEIDTQALQATEPGLAQPVPQEVTLPLRLGTILRQDDPAVGEPTTTVTGDLANAPVNADGDLVVPEGYRLEFEFSSPTGSRAGSYTLYYDAQGFASHLALPVSPKSGDGPTVASFDAAPDAGEVPLSTNFTGIVEAGEDPIDHVEIDPGDGTDPIQANLTNGSFHEQHVYEQTGEYSATVTVVDTANRTDSATASVVVQREEAVYVTIDDHPAERAVDTSAEGDWSTWELAHDFSHHANGSMVSVSAVYVDGVNASAPHTIDLRIGGTPTGNVSIEAPPPGATLEFPAEFQGAYTVPDNGSQGSDTSLDTSQESASETSLPSASSPPELGGGDGRPSQAVLGEWLSDPFVQQVFSSPAVRDFQKQASGWAGFLALFPDADTRELVVALEGSAPADAPRTVAGWTVRYEEKLEPETLNDHEGPSAPGIQGNGAGPGSPLRIGNFICSASYLVQDRVTERYFIATAGHCLAGGGEHVELRKSVSVCIRRCISNAAGIGAYVNFFPKGEYDPVFYARNQGVGADFGLIEVPDRRVDNLRPYLTQFGGPQQTENPGFGELLVHYGHGAYCCPAVGAIATRTPVDQGRVAISLGGGLSAIGWASGGDSGSAVGTATVSAPGVIEGRGAAGVLTHGIVVDHVPLFMGTPMRWGMNRVETVTDTDLRLVTENENPTPACPNDQDCPPVAQFEATGDGSDVHFDASDSYHPRYSELTDYRWAFGDGTTGEGEQIRHLYQEPGIYNVTLTVTDEQGRTNTTTKTVTAERPATAWAVQARVVDDAGNVTVPWTTIEQPEPGENGTWTFTWDGPSDPGNRTLQVRLTEDGVERTRAERSYEVPPLAAEANGPYTGVVNESITFQGNASFGVEPYTFEWAFGDGATATGQVVEHSYDEAGNYTVQLNVTDAGNHTATDTTTVEVFTSEPMPVVEITDPEDGDHVEGEILIQGTAGHARAENETDSGTTTQTHQSSSADPSRLDRAGAKDGDGSGDEALPRPGSEPTSTEGFLPEPGQPATLWFRGEELMDGVGEPTAADTGQLRPTPPDGDVPVTHTGFWTLPSVRLQSPPLDDELRLGTGETETPNRANTTFHLSTWTLNDLVGGADWVVDLTATHPSQGELRLARTEIDTQALQGTEPGLAQPVPQEVTMPLRLGTILRQDNPAVGEATTTVTGDLPNAPVNADGDLVVPEGYRLEFEFSSPTGSRAGSYTLYYDAEDLDSRIHLPVSPATGSPSIEAFEARDGDAPFTVNFTGVVDPGLAPVDRLEIDPGDGTGPISANLTGDTFYAEHVYPETGNYTATATAVDTENRTDSATAPVTVQPEEGVYVTVNDHRPERAIDTSAEGDWSTWELAHDFSHHANGSTISVRAVYVDGANESAPHLVNVTVGAASTEPLEAVIEGPNETVWKQNTTFDGSNSTGPIEAWLWDFDDGTRATGPVVEHAWDRPGWKNVTLTVSDGEGAEDTAQHRVLVKGGQPGNPR